MSENTIFVKTYDNADPRLRLHTSEIWRYSGYQGGEKNVDERMAKLLQELLTECATILSYKVCYREVERGELRLGIHSKNLQNCLRDSERVIIFAATVGLELDRRIARYGRISPTKSLLLQAYGAERVESLCNVFCEEYAEKCREEKLFVTPRFSPGYGDLELREQREIFRLLDCNRKIGVSLNASLLMTPSKSVTAVFGLSHCRQTSDISGCAACGKKNCEFRREK